MTAAATDICPTTELDVRWCGCRKHKRRASQPSPLPESTPDQARRAAGRSKTQRSVWESSERDDVRLVARFLPEGFIDLYALVLEVEFGGRSLGSFSARADPEMRVSTSKRPAEIHTIRRERALWGRYKLDRKLKRITADLRNLLVELDNPYGSRPIKRQCAGKCHKFGDPDHVYCPWCGGPMQDVG